VAPLHQQVLRPGLHRGLDRQPWPPAPHRLRHRQPRGDFARRRYLPGKRRVHRDRPAQARDPADVLPLRLRARRQPDRAVQPGARLMLAPDWKPITWTEAERAKGQAWGLKTIESFHTHGTPPTVGAEQQSATGDYALVLSHPRLGRDRVLVAGKSGTIEFGHDVVEGTHADGGTAGGTGVRIRALAHGPGLRRDERALRTAEGSRAESRRTAMALSMPILLVLVRRTPARRGLLPAAPRFSGRPWEVPPT
jgi:hypothetical protein